MAANITIGILSVPHEWGWTYVMLMMLPGVFLLTDAGRSFGLDAFLAPRLDRAAEGAAASPAFAGSSEAAGCSARHTVRPGIEEERMSLKEELKALRARLEAGRPPEVAAAMHRAIDDLRGSGVQARVLKVGYQGAGHFALPDA